MQILSVSTFATGQHRIRCSGFESSGYHKETWSRLAMTLSALFCNKYSIYWERGYQVTKDKNDTEMQGQSTVFGVLRSAKQSSNCADEGTAAFPSDASVSSNAESTF